MAKMTNRKQASGPTPNHVAGPSGAGGPSAGTPGANAMAAPATRPNPSSGGGVHQAAADGSATGNSDEVSGMFHQI